jgi:site-specific DNA-methyltransferase (adenine-specific)
MRIGNGDFWLGDCLELMATIPDTSVDMILCDLPYGTTACKWDAVIPFDALWAHYWRIAKPTAAVVLTAAQPFTSALVMSQIERFRYSWIWVKNRPTLAVHAKNRPMPKHEDVLVFSRGKWGHASQLGANRLAYNPQGAVSTGKTKVIKEKGSQPSYNGKRPNLVGREYEPMTNMPHTVLEVSKEEDHAHPTQKPVALFEYLIRTYTDEGMIVLDNCAGSGTTAIAAERSGRRWICIEQEPGYYYPAVGRVWSEVTAS